MDFPHIRTIKNPGDKKKPGADDKKPKPFVEKASFAAETEASLQEPSKADLQNISTLAGNLQGGTFAQRARAAELKAARARSELKSKTPQASPSPTRRIKTFKMPRKQKWTPLDLSKISDESPPVAGEAGASVDMLEPMSSDVGVVEGAVEKSLVEESVLVPGPGQVLIENKVNTLSENLSSRLYGSQPTSTLQDQDLAEYPAELGARIENKMSPPKFEDPFKDQQSRVVDPQQAAYGHASNIDHSQLGYGHLYDSYHQQPAYDQYHDMHRNQSAYAQPYDINHNQPAYGQSYDVDPNQLAQSQSHNFSDVHSGYGQPHNISNIQSSYGISHNGNNTQSGYSHSYNDHHNQPNYIQAQPKSYRQALTNHEEDTEDQQMHHEQQSAAPSQAHGFFDTMNIDSIEKELLASFARHQGKKYEMPRGGQDFGVSREDVASDPRELFMNGNAKAAYMKSRAAVRGTPAANLDNLGPTGFLDPNGDKFFGGQGSNTNDIYDASFSRSRGNSILKGPAINNDARPSLPESRADPFSKVQDFGIKSTSTGASGLEPHTKAFLAGKPSRSGIAGHANYLDPSINPFLNGKADGTNKAPPTDFYALFSKALTESKESHPRGSAQSTLSGAPREIPTNGTNPAPLISTTQTRNDVGRKASDVERAMLLLHLDSIPSANPGAQPQQARRGAISGPSGQSIIGSPIADLNYGSQPIQPHYMQAQNGQQQQKRRPKLWVPDKDYHGPRAPDAAAPKVDADPEAERASQIKSLDEWFMRDARLTHQEQRCIEEAVEAERRAIKHRNSLRGASAEYTDVKEGKVKDPAAPYSDDDMVKDLLVPAIGILAKLKNDRGPENQFSKPPSWAIDHTPGGNESFFSQQWGTPPQRVGRDPRYRAMQHDGRSSVFEDPTGRFPREEFSHGRGRRGPGGPGGSGGSY